MLLLKTLGLDPQVIMTQVESARVSCNEVITHFDARLTAIEKQQEQIMLTLDLLVKMISDPKVQ
jgi:hypothetical protein